MGSALLRLVFVGLFGCTILHSPQLTAGINTDLETLIGQGRQLYLSGLWEGEPIPVRVGSEDSRLDSSLLPCASCHGEDGRGRPEGGVQPPDIAWHHLRRSVRRSQAGTASGRRYTLESFAQAVTDGIAPAGRTLNPAMPRYELSAKQVAALVAYLRIIRSDLDPGIEDDTLTIATYVPVPDSPRARMHRAQLKMLFDRINADGGIYERSLRLVVHTGVLTELTTELNDPDRKDSPFAWVAPLTGELDPSFSELNEMLGVPYVGAYSDSPRSASLRFGFYLLPELTELIEVCERYLESRSSDPLAIYDAMDIESTSRSIDREASSARVPIRIVPADGRGRLKDLVSDGMRRWIYVGTQGAWGPFINSIHNSPSHMEVCTPMPFSGRIPASIDSPVDLFLAMPWLPMDRTGEAYAEFVELARALGQSPSNRLLAHNFAAVRVLEEGLKRVGRNVDRQHFAEAMRSLTRLNTGSLGPVSFGTGRHTGIQGGYVIRVSGTTPEDLALRPVTGRIVP